MVPGTNWNIAAACHSCQHSRRHCRGVQGKLVRKSMQKTPPIGPGSKEGNHSQVLYTVYCTSQAEIRKFDYSAGIQYWFPSNLEPSVHHQSCFQQTPGAVQHECDAQVSELPTCKKCTIGSIDYSMGPPILHV